MAKKVLPKFVFIAPNKSDVSMGAGFVLQTVKPFALGRVLKFRPEEYISTDPQQLQQEIATAEVPGYSVVIAYAGNIEGYRIYAESADWEKDLQSTMEQMARWYLQEKIMNNQGYYKRYKL